MESILMKSANESEITFSSEEDFSDEDRPITYQGKLFKWTNMLHGWQERFFVLKDGTLSYYKSREDVELGCRGSIRLNNSTVRPHEADDCRFEVRVGDSIWYLRGVTLQDRRKWIECVEHHRITESGYNGGVNSEQTSLRRQNSWHSLNSANSLSIASASSFKRSHGLKEKLAEMETFKEILCRQVESLQNYFDTCSAIVRDSAHDNLERYLEDDEIGAMEIEDHDASTNTTDEHILHNEHLSHHNNQSQHGKQKMQTHLSKFGDNVSECSSNSNHSFPFSNPNNCTSAVITNGQIEAANNGTIFEDDREALAGNNNKTLQPVTPVKGHTRQPSSISIDDDQIYLEDDGYEGGGSGIKEHSEDCDYNEDEEEEEDKEDIPATKSISSPEKQPARSFLSKFFPFRSSSSNSNNNSQATAAPLPEPVQDEKLRSNVQNCYPDQYEPSLRFEDLKRIIKQHGGHALDFKGESYTFKATTTGILTNLAYCVEIMQQREDQWRRRVEREVDRRKRLEESHKNLLQELASLQSKLSEMRAQQLNQQQHIDIKVPSHTSESIGNIQEDPTMSGPGERLIVGSPDLEEGPNCTIGEEEFFDAVDAQLDIMDEADDRKAAFLTQTSLRGLSTSSASNTHMPTNHPLYGELEREVKEHSTNCMLGASALPGSAPTGVGWELVAEEGEMKIYKKEVESEDGLVLDPLQIVHEINGVTAKEFCQYFWDVKYRLDWEISIDQPPTILEWCSDDTVVLHQVYKRVWPTTQRDSVYWSHIRQLKSFKNKPDNSNDNSDIWMVLNYSSNYRSSEVDESCSQMIRLTLDVALICQTIVSTDASTDRANLSRENIRCRILYTSSINPGGWAPASVLRTVAKREYPRFIKRFSQYVIDQTAELPLELEL